MAPLHRTKLAAMTHYATAHQKALKETLCYRRCYLFLLLTALSASKGYAAELKASIYSETRSTSNARLVATNVKDDVIERIGVNLVLKEERKRFNADASLNFYQDFYLNNTYSDQTQLTTGFGLFNFDIVEDFLDWRTSFTRTQVLSDTTATDTPDNREERNTFRTGPTINYRINRASTLRMGTNYVQVENSDEISADTKRVNANTSYIYQYNSITDFSLNGSYDQILESDQGGALPLNDDKIKNMTLNIGMNRQFSRGSFSINAGQNQVYSDTRDTVRGNFFDILFQHEQVLFHDLQVQYSESISDSSIGFGSFEDLVATNPNLGDGNQQFETTTPLDIVKQKRADISINRNIDSYQYSLNIFWNNLDYDLQLNDERSTGLTFNLRQQIQDGLTAGFTYQQVKQVLFDRPGDGDNDTQTYTIDSAYRWTKDFSTNGFITYVKRENNKNALREYEDLSVGVTLNWDLY